MGDLTIVGIDTIILDVPLVRPHRFATTSMTTQPILLVSIMTGGGVIGHGEGVVPGGPWWGGESVETMKAIIDRYISPILRNRDVDSVARIMLEIDKVVSGAWFAKAGIEIALYDAWARCMGVPVYKLLGGAVRTCVDVTWTLGVAPAAEIVDEAIEKIERRMHFSFKLKMGALDPNVDTLRVLSVVDGLAGKAGIRVDVNARWDRLTALQYAPRLAGGGVELIEQPTPGDQIDVLAELRRVLPVPLMADESVQTPHDALEIVCRGAADVIAVKTTKCGGLSRSRAVAAIARAGGIACHGATSIEGPIGTAASLHFACSEPAIDYGTELFGPLLFAVCLVQDPLVYRDGKLHLPEGPGLGVELDMAAVRSVMRD